MIPERRVDIVVGLVSTRPVSGGVLNEVTAGMAEYFPQYGWKLIQAVTAAPGNSGRELPVDRFGVHRVTYPWHAVPAKTNGYRAILAAAQKAGASACLLADAGHDGFRRGWVDALVRPGIHSRYDLVTPRYRGSQRDSILSANLLSPMLLALFGRSTRQPMSGDFLLSARLIRQLLARHDWDSLPARYTPELWMQFAALAAGCRVAETLVSSRGRPTGPASPLPAHVALAQIVEGLFVLMDQYDGYWQLPAAPVLARI
jgi:hypothetical protein